MTDTKTFVIPEGGGYGNGCLDPNLLLSMNGGGFGGGMWNNPIWALVFLAFLGNGFGGWGGGNNSQLSQIQDTLNTNQGNTLLMDAIKGNQTAIGQLSQTIGCNFNAVQTAINGVQGAICNLGSRNDMSAMQIVNAINSGNASLANQLSSCCCDVKQLVTTQGYENRINNIEQSNMITKGFGDIAYATQAQTTALAANNDSNTRAVLAKLDAIEDSRKDREIASLTAALTAANSRAERQAELAPVYQALNDIKCKQPETITIPYSPVTAVPSCVAWNAALYGGFGPYYNGGQFG